MHSGPEFQKGAPVVYIHPLYELDHQKDVAVLPFQMPDNIPGAEGRKVAALFKDVFLGARTFERVRQVDEYYGSLDDAITVGRLAGADYVLAGAVKSIMEGSELGGARAEVAVRLLDCRDGNTLWYVEQAVFQPLDQPDLGFWHRLKISLTMPPVRPTLAAPAAPNLLSRVAYDVAVVIGGVQKVGR